MGAPPDIAERKELAESVRLEDGDTNLAKPQRLAKSLLLTVGIRFASASGTMLLSVVLARTLTKDEFGLFSFCMTTMVTLSMLARYGLDSTLLRFGGSAWHSRKFSQFHGYTAWAFSMTLRHSIIFAIIGLLAAWGLGARWQGSSVMSLMLITLIPWSMVYTISFVLKGAHQTPTGAMFEVGSCNILTAICVVLLVLTGRVVSTIDVALVLMVCTVAVFSVGLLTLKLRGLWPKISQEIASTRKEFNDSCRQMSVICMMQLLAISGGIFFLGLVWNDAEVAIYAAPAKLAAATILLTNVVILVIAPRLSGHYKAGEETQFQRVLRRGSIAVCAVNVPILTVIILTSPWIMWLMGPNYAEHYMLLSIMAAGQLIGIIAGLAPTVLCMTGYEKQWSKLTTYNAGTCVVVSAVLCYFLGALGAAIGTAMYQATQSWAAAFLVKRIHGFWTIPGLHHAALALRSK